MQQRSKVKDKGFKRIIITPGEPAGIGPDITIAIAQQSWPVELLVIADPDVLLQRAEQLNLPLQCHLYDAKSHRPHQAGSLIVLPVKTKAAVIPGTLNPANASYVIKTLELAASLCLQQEADGIVTGPVHKAIINQAGITFTGHTEFFAQYCGVEQTVMMFMVDQLKVALATTHLPLSQVSAKLTQTHLRSILKVLIKGLQQQFHLTSPRLTVCGLNPHAGEEGHLGREEIDVIEPVLAELRAQGHHLIGPLPADTAFIPTQLAQADVTLAMYHDQALPLIKYLGFDRAVNLTLGLPFIRTSVDHGTALHLAGTGRADSGSMQSAIKILLSSIRPSSNA